VSASTTITLDTTGPAGVALNIDAGAPFSTDLVVDAQPTTTDTVTTGYEMKIWGDVNPATDPAVGLDEAGSDWVPYATTYPVELSSGDGPKTLTVRLRDDVGNQSSTANRQITLDTTLPVPTVTIEAAPDKISEVGGFNISTFTFQVNADIVAWKVKAVPSTSSLEGAGTTVPTTAGSINTTGGALTSGTSREVTITGTDLKAASSADGTKILKVFVQDATDQWSV
jgi:hypothetical protein